MFYLSDIDPDQMCRAGCVLESENHAEWGLRYASESKGVGSCYPPGECMKIMFRLYHLLAFLLLLGFAAVQLNDPDPLFWGGFYVACATIPLLAVFRINSWILYALCVAYGIAVIAPTLDGFFEYQRHSESLVHGMSPDRPYIEEAREFLGALIAFVLITVSMLGRRRAISSNKVF
jgi:hypothetical protein